MEYRHAVLEIIKNRPSEGYRGNEKEVYVLREKLENRRLVSGIDLIENVSVHSMNCIYIIQSAKVFILPFMRRNGSVLFAVHTTVH